VIVNLGWPYCASNGLEGEYDDGEDSTMCDVFPAWIRKVRAARDEDNAVSSAIAQEQAKARIANEGLQYWSRFVQRLSVNTDALPETGELGICGTVAEVKSPDPKEHCCRVEVTIRNGLLKSTYVDLLYPRQGGIRLSFQQSREEILPLVVEGGRVLAACGRATLEPEELADDIVERLYSAVKCR
jgi:hypothetical protein